MNFIPPALAAPTICSLLHAAGRLDGETSSRAERLSRESGEHIVAVLTRLGLIGERALVDTLAQLLELQIASAADFPLEPVLPALLSRRFLQHFRVVPVSATGTELVLAMADPLDAYAVEAVSFATERAVLPRPASMSDIEAALERQAETVPTERTAHGVPGRGDAEDVERLRDLASDAPIIRLVHGLIARAVDARASDIHFEAEEGHCRVRFRIDGVLSDVERLPDRMSGPLTSRIKIMAKLNIAEKRLAQDGRIRFAVRGKEVDFRVATMPTMHGESVVLRILDRGNLNLDFKALGFDDTFLGGFRPLLDRPHGILLVTGPTGSGKTTTLYSALAAVSRPELKILTIEDPIEYQLPGVNQSQVKPQIGLTFASALRAFLRQDPDVIMVGEIRDLETAQVAVQASLTGHLILSTLHTNNAASAVTRLLDMGVEDYLITSTVGAVVGQRLVRTLCPDCREPYTPPAAMLDRYGLEAAELFRPLGCATCGGSGFSGRTTIAELLVVSDAIRTLVLAKAEAAEIQRAAVAAGMHTMFADGVSKAAAGITTLDEVVRVTRDS